MSKLREGYYKTVNNFYELLKVVSNLKVELDNLITFSMKVENGKITITDGMGNEFTMTVEYGVFGKIYWAHYRSIHIIFKGEVYPEIKEKIDATNYNFQLKMIFTEGMAEGWREMVKILIIL